jgi:uncharacterized protein with FMN-binding domain
MTTTPRRKAALSLLTGLALTSSLVGCAADAAPTGSAPAEEPTTASDTPTSTATATAGSTYADGTYAASGSYQSPHGTESIEVTVTLDDDVITAVTVVGNGDNPESLQYQSEFADGIGAIVVGHDIDTISVSRVAGSSLTSGGFAAAIEAIKADAA